MLIDGIALSGYRSFGSKLQKFGPLQKINILIGQNNSGKSNILKFLKEHYVDLVNVIRGRKPPSELKFSELDTYKGPEQSSFQFGIGLNLEGPKYSAIKDMISHRRGEDQRRDELIDRLISAKLFTDGSRAAFFIYQPQSSFKSGYAFSPDWIKKIIQENILSPEEWRYLWSQSTGTSGGSLENHWIPESLKHLSPVNIEIPKIEMIPAIRKVSQTVATPDYSGEGIIHSLAKIQNPSYNEPHLRKSFDQINEFAREVLGNNSVSIEIPYQRDMINVYMDGKTLPLDSMGTGVHEVIILAAAATVLKNHVLCIEEPELHLHPVLQKKLICYLLEKTDNQYIISTHSAHFMDTPNAAVFHIKYDKGNSIIESAISPKEKSTICNDLGYRASDLLQSNSIIWVEGPSDRIYLNHWLQSIDPSLIEGIHYSIMFYGGRLASHLSAEDSSIEDFISLRKLNRNICIVMDSDMSKSTDRINKTKKRLQKEFDKGQGFAWVTKGREIENYIDPKLLEKAIKQTHSNVKSIISLGKYSNCLEYKRKNKNDTVTADKIKVALKVSKSKANLDILDLRKMMEKLRGFIRVSNGLEKKLKK